MKKWFVVGALVAAAAIALAVFATQSGTPDADTVVDNFRAVERNCIQAFNAALGEQRTNQIDELELAVIVERDVLGPWRELRRHVSAAPVPETRRDLYETMRRYLETRQIAWEAYAASLRSPSQEAARPHYDVYHQRNADAQAEAQILGRMFRAP